METKYLQYCLDNGLNSDLHSSLASYKLATKRKSSLKSFYYSVAVWTKYGDLKTKRVTVKAKNQESGNDKINKRYPKAYDISGQ